MTFKRPCLFCSEPAESISMYCMFHKDEQKNARTSNKRVNQFINEQYHEFVAPSRGWGTRHREEFVVVEEFDEQTGKRIGVTRVPAGREPGDPLYEDEMGWFDVRTPHDVYVHDTTVTLEHMRENDSL
jgi:hypothetical protein